MEIGWDDEQTKVERKEVKEQQESSYSIDTRRIHLAVIRRKAEKPRIQAHIMEVEAF
jgi:hypothetical protein